MPIDPQVLKKLSIHGHRGSRGTHPENTLPAFEEAISSGAHVLELDLQLTRDDVPVVSHDPDITGRLCRYRDGRPVEKPIPIRSLAVRELDQFECGAIAQRRFPHQKLIDGVALPTFETFLQFWKKNAPKLEMNVETKMTADDPKWIPDPELFVSKILELLRRYDAVEKCILQSFDFRTLVAAGKKEPKLRLSCLFEDEKHFCEPTSKVGARWASPNLNDVTSAEVERCHAKGIFVVPWTANERAEWTLLLESGVDAIITDYPRQLHAFVKELSSR